MHLTEGAKLGRFAYKKKGAGRLPAPSVEDLISRPRLELKHGIETEWSTDVSWCSD